MTLKTGNLELVTPPPDRRPSVCKLKRIRRRLQTEPLIKKAYLAWVTSPRQPEGSLQLGLEFREDVDTDGPIVPGITEQLWKDLDPLIGLEGVIVVNAFLIRGGYEDYVREIPCIYSAKDEGCP